MFLFRHVLQLCTIACISVATESHVLLAVNVEDFRNIASQFLSKSLAQRLTRLVSENAGGNRRDDTQDDFGSGIDFNIVAELIRDRLLTQHKTTAPSTKNTRNQNINKRFNTVKNTVNTAQPPKNTKRILRELKTTKRILRDPNYKTSAGLIYIKDDVETLFQNYNQQPNTYDTTQHEYSETRPNESYEETVSQEPTSTNVDVKENTELKHDAQKKMDNTEAKLGEWLYNNIIAEKPTKLQNHKTGNMDINDEGNADDLPDGSESIRNVQYIYSLSEQDKSKHNLAAELQSNKDTNNFNLQDQQTDGANNDYIMGPKMNTIYKKKPQKQVIEDNLEIENEVMNKREYVKPIPGNGNTFNRESFGLGQDQQADEQGIHESIMRPQLNTIYKEKPKKQQIEENYLSSHTKDQEIEDFLVDRPEYVNTKLGNKNTYNNNEKTDFDKGAGMMPANLKELNPGPDKLKIERFLSDVDEVKQQSIEKHIMYDKYVLGSEHKENNQKEPRWQSVQETKSPNNNRVDPQKVDNSDEALRLEIQEVFNHNEEADYQSISDIKKTKDYLPPLHKDVKPDSDKPKIERTLHDTVKVKIQEGVKRITSTNENNIQRKGPQNHSTEKNNIHETYAVSSERIKKHTNIKPLSDDDYVSKKGSKHRYGDVSDKDRKEGSVAVAKQRPKKKAPINNEKSAGNLTLGFESAKLGSSSDETNEKQVKEHDTANKYKLGTQKETSKKQSMEEDDKYENKYNKRPQKHLIEENDTHGTYALSSETKNKKDGKYDNRYNKRPQKHSIEENDTHETYALSSETKHKSDEKYDNRYNKRPQKYSIEENDSRTKNKKDDRYNKHKSNKYKHKETSKKQTEENETNEKNSPESKNKNKTKSKKQPIEENNMYEIYALGSKPENKDREMSKDDDNNENEETGLGKRNKGNHGRDKESDNDDEMILNNKNRHILKITKKVNRPTKEDVPLEGYADDPRPDFKEVKPEHIKARTYRIRNSDERKGRPTKRFTMKGTLIPKREFYKLSSPNYYKDLPRNVEKYDFSEPIPERDRQRDKVRYLKREPARVNKKLKLPRFERVT